MSARTSRIRLVLAAAPVLAAAGIAATLPTTDAHALSCMPPQVTMTPGPQAEAPLNVRVVVTVPLNAGLVSKLEQLPAVRFELRPREQPARGVAVRRVDLGAGLQRQVELVPLAQLSPSTTYEVIATQPERSDVPARTIGVFRTGTDVDVAAPVWNGVTRATLAPQTKGKWGPSGPTATFHFGAAGDESTANEELRFGVWLPDAQGRFDYSKAPATYASAHGLGQFVLTGGQPCGWATFRFPITTRVGVRAVDLAGNLGSASEVRLVSVKH
jgi:hypothetical protein